jgi:UDP-galactose transporter
MRRNEAIDVSLDDDIDAHAAAAAAAAHLLDAPMNYSLGVTSILIAAAVSGLTSVYFEKILKDSGATVSIWVRNTQMAFYSLLAALIGGVLWQDGAEIAVHGFFEGYNWVVWTAVLLQTFGGIVASLVIRDTDNIVKTFATSISIVISFLISVYLFDDFSFGLTVCTTLIYSPMTITNLNVAVPDWHITCPLRNIPLRHARPSARFRHARPSSTTNQDRKLRKANYRESLHPWSQRQCQTRSIGEMGQRLGRIY